MSVSMEEANMKLAKLAIAILIISLESISSYAQRAPICDVSCGPDPGSTSYLSNVGSRAKLNNARGSSSPVAPRQAIVMSTLIGMTQQLPGSQSFIWSMPLVSLPGRTGLDVTLILQYN